MGCRAPHGGVAEAGVGISCQSRGSYTLGMPGRVATERESPASHNRTPINYAWGWDMEELRKDTLNVLRVRQYYD